MKLNANRFSGMLIVTGIVMLFSAVAVSAQPIPLSELQKQWLDPRADNGSSTNAVSLPAPLDPRHNMAGMSMVTNSAVATPVNTSTLPQNGGQWSYLPSFPTGFNAPHMIVGKGGKVLLVAGSGNTTANSLSGNLQSYIWNPVTGTRRLITTPNDLFCAGHVLLPDGRALVVGGTKSYHPFLGSNTIYAFNFDTEAYERLPNMAHGRWYPSVVTMPDGRQVIAAGLNENGVSYTTNEIFNPKTNTISQLPGARSFPLYPRLQLAENGKIFHSLTASPGFWDPLANTYQKVGGVITTVNTAVASCFVGDVRDQNLIDIGGGWPATNKTRIIKLNAPMPVFQDGPSLSAAKAYTGCVNLPDGNLFEANGGNDNTFVGASLEASMLASTTSNWTAMTSLPIGEHRVYHSVLALLDDGRVLSMTSNPNSGAPRSTSVLAYSPPYLFKGQRPVITIAPTIVNYGGTYPVSSTAVAGTTVQKMMITSAPAPTHGQDTGQRSLSIPILNGTITLPTESTIMPPGMYRLWAIDTSGVPSVASWFQII